MIVLRFQAEAGMLVEVGFRLRPLRSCMPARTGSSTSGPASSRTRFSTTALEHHRGNGPGLARVGALFRDGSLNPGFVGIPEFTRISDVARYSGSAFTSPIGFSRTMSTRCCSSTSTSPPTLPQCWTNARWDASARRREASTARTTRSPYPPLTRRRASEGVRPAARLQRP